MRSERVRLGIFGRTNLGSTCYSIISEDRVLEINSNFSRTSSIMAIASTSGRRLRKHSRLNSRSEIGITRSYTSKIYGADIDIINGIGSTIIGMVSNRWCS